MKICYLSCYSGIGGAEVYALNLAKSAKADGLDVIFVLSEPGPIEFRLKKAGIKYFFIPMKSSFNPFTMVSSSLKLKKLFAKEGVNIVHTQMLREQSLTILAKIMGTKVKLIRTFHRLDQFNWKMKPLMFLYRSKTDKFIAINEYSNKYLENNGIKEKVTVVKNGAEEIKVSGHELNAGYWGRLSDEKGILELCQIWPDKVPKLIVGGSGTLEKEIKEVVKQNKNIEFVGQANLGEFYSKVAVSVLPSKSEVMPLSVIESFSAGVPVVAFDLKPLRGLITIEVGELVEGGNFRKIIEASTKLLKNDTLLFEKAEKSREVYKKNFTIDEMWINTKKVYLELAD